MTGSNGNPNVRLQTFAGRTPDSSSGMPGLGKGKEKYGAVEYGNGHGNGNGNGSGTYNVQGTDFDYGVPNSMDPSHSLSALRIETVKPKQSVTSTKLLGILFLACIGGAYGVEDALRAAGPFWTLMSMVVLPWTWGYPVCLMTAELSAAFPSNAGPIYWVFLSSGPFWTVQCTLWTLFSYITDNALYPALFADYIASFVGGELPPVTKVILKVGLVVGSIFLNILGVEAVGWTSVAMTVCVVSPFIVLFFFTLPVMDFKPSFDVFTFKEINWTVFLPVITWNLNGFDSAGHISEEVSNPQTTYRRACRCLMVLTQVVYILPIIASASINNNWPIWHDGFFVNVAEQLGNYKIYKDTPAFEYIMLGGGVISAVGFMCTLLCTTSRAIYGMAKLDFFPSIVSRPLRSLNQRFATPHWSIIVNGVLTLMMTLFFQFDQLVGVDVTFYSMRMFLEWWALAQLRRRPPYCHFPRPFLVQGGMWTIALLALVPLSVCMANVIVTIFTSEVTVVIMTLAGIVICAAIGVAYAHWWPDKLSSLGSPQIIAHHGSFAKEPTESDPLIRRQEVEHSPVQSYGGTEDGTPYAQPIHRSSTESDALMGKDGEGTPEPFRASQSLPLSATPPERPSDLDESPSRTRRIARSFLYHNRSPVMSASVGGDFTNQNVNVGAGPVPLCLPYCTLPNFDTTLHFVDERGSQRGSVPVSANRTSPAMHSSSGILAGDAGTLGLPHSATTGSRRSVAAVMGAAASGAASGPGEGGETSGGGNNNGGHIRRLERVRANTGGTLPPWARGRGGQDARGAGSGFLGSNDPG